VNSYLYFQSLVIFKYNLILWNSNSSSVPLIYDSFWSLYKIDVNLFIHTLGLHVCLNSLSKISIYTFCNTILFNTVSSCIWVLFIWFATKQFLYNYRVNVILSMWIKEFSVIS
jgi:hypothetical protein